MIKIILFFLIIILIIFYSCDQKLPSKDLLLKESDSHLSSAISQKKQENEKIQEVARPDRVYVKNIREDFLVGYQKQLRDHIRKCFCGKFLKPSQKKVDVFFTLDAKNMTILDLNILSLDGKNCIEECMKHFVYKGQHPSTGLKYPLKLVLTLL